MDKWISMMEQKAALERQRKAIDTPLGYFGTVTNSAVMPQSDVLMLGTSANYAPANYVRASNVGTG